MKTFNHGFRKWKNKRPLLYLAAAFLFFLLAGKYNHQFPHDEIPPAANQELFHQSAEHFPEADSGKDSSPKGISAIMIGLPF